jgi:hypothetical protein
MDSHSDGQTPPLSFETRTTLIRLAFYIDLFPRITFALILPVGMPWPGIWISIRLAPGCQSRQLGLPGDCSHFA